MLDTTMASVFEPGTNIKDEVSKANWAFLLPSLELETIICYGEVSAAQLESLAAAAQAVIVLCAHARAVQAVAARGQQLGLHNLRALPFNASSLLPTAGATLVLLTSASIVRRINHDQTLQAELQRILHPTGAIYVEQRSPQLPAFLHTLGTSQAFWLTPITGAMHTAVPADDPATIHYFIQNQLTSRSFDLARLKRRVRRIKTQPTTRVAESALLPNARQRKAARPSLPMQVKRSIHTAIRRLAQYGQYQLDRVEHRLYAQAGVARLFQRYGVLIACGTATLNQPPAYLQAIAHAAAIPIEQYRWGLVARGEYRSRKVLFFLFSPQGTAPSYIIKMTRAPALNARLENEYRALNELAARGIGDNATLPRAVFCGYHNNLAIVGETIIAGQPFEQCSNGQPNCSYAQAALAWLTQLGAQTVSSCSAFEATTTLDSLFTRFTQIYRLTDTQHAFMRAQIATIASQRIDFPLVFQHGDPGTWNTWVTPTHRVAWLDWEAAESAGMPLWDLFYFIRTYGAWARRAETSDVLKGFAEQFLNPSPWQMLLIAATAGYCAKVGVPGALIAPLFYTCWMHRALKEATRISIDTLEHGHYVNLLRASIDQRDQLAALFALHHHS